MKTNTRLACECLETRETPAVVVTQEFVTLTITGSNSADDVRVLTNLQGHVQVQTRTTAGSPWTALPDTYSNVKKVVFIGAGGDDSFRNDSNLVAHANGGQGKDTLIGGEGDDYLMGFIGDDTLNGRGGNDTLAGYDGNDRVWGGEGDDRLFGTQGDDHLYGQGGNDYLTDQAGEDLGGGNNVLDGGTGRDVLWGGVGNDYLNGGQDGEADTLTGNFGTDTFVKESWLAFLPNLDAPNDLNLYEGDTVVSQKPWVPIPL